MKLKTSQIVMLINALTTANLSKTTTADKTAIIRLTAALRREGIAWNEFLDEARKRCRPDGFDEIAEKYNRLKELEDNERKAVEEAVAKYNAEVDEIVRPEYEAEKDISAAPLDDEALARLADSNPEWTMQDIMALRDLIGQPEEEE